MKKELNLNETAHRLDPTTVQDNADFDEKGKEEHPDFIHTDPDQIKIPENNVTTKGIFRIIEIPCDNVLKDFFENPQ